MTEDDPRMIRRIREHVGSLHGPLPPLEPVRRRARRRTWSRRLSSSAVIVIAAVAIAVPLRQLGGLRDTDGGSRTSTAPSEEPTVAPPSAVHLTTSIETVPVAAYPNAVAVGEGGVWVSAPSGDGSGGGDVVRLDPVSAEVVDRIHVDHLPGWESGGGGLAAGDGSVWAMGDERVDSEMHAIVTRIDPSTNTVAGEFDLGPGSEGDVWAADGVLWAVQFTSVPNELEVVRVDPANGRIEARIPVPGEWSQQIFTFGDSVWVSALTAGTDDSFGGPGSQHLLVHVDAVTDRYVGSVSCAFDEVTDEGGCDPDVTVSADVFYAWAPGGVRRYDGVSGAEVGAPIAGPAASGGLVSDDRGGLWLYQPEGASDDRVFEHVDGSGTTIGTGRIGGQERGAWEGVARSFDPSTNSIWVVQYRGSVSMIRID